MKVAGARVCVYEDKYLLTVRELIGRYAAQEFDSTNSFYSGAPGRIMRARARLQNNIDTAWSAMSPPIVTIITDSEGRFEFHGPLPASIGLFCFAGRSNGNGIERIRWAVSENQFPESNRMLLTDENRLR
jgi:hypothetical protein